MSNPHDPLTPRRSAILSAVVGHYVRTGEPVGSKTLVERYRMDVSPATVRNEMAALEEAGYIYHPHTSAGRVPTDSGYRHYVDTLGTAAKLPKPDVRRVEEFYFEPRWALEDALRQTAHLLSGLTRHAAVVFAPALDRSLIKHIELIGLAPGRAMLIVVTDAGRLENRLVGVSEDADDETLLKISDALNAAIAGTPLEQLARNVTAAVLHLAPELRPVARAVEQALSDEAIDPSDRVYLEGASHIFDDGKSSDIDTVRSVIGALEHRRLLLEVLADALASSSVSVRIGSENEAAEMQACSVVAAPYAAGDQVIGSLGVVGPTRMDYRRTIAAVYEVSAHLGHMLSAFGS